MKKVLTNPYLIAAVILGGCIALGYKMTYGNRKWILAELSALQFPDEEWKKMQAQTTAQLRAILKSKQI